MTAALPPAPVARPGRAIQILGIPLLALLAIEFLLGMALDLYVGPGSGTVAAILASNPVLIVHIIVALMLVGITGRALVLSVRSGERALIVGSALGLAGALVATLAGSAFTFGSPSNAASYTMSGAFALILVGAAILLRPVPATDGPATALASGGVRTP